MKIFHCKMSKQDENNYPDWKKDFIIQAKDMKEAEEIVKENIKEFYSEPNIHYKLRPLNMDWRMQVLH